MPRLRLPKNGEVRADGHVYVGAYRDNRTGKTSQSWASPVARYHWRLNSAVSMARRRARAGDLPFNLTRAHLEEIFPVDGLCPVLRTPMVWGYAGGKNNCPSLDRRVPELGYVIGNVGFVSNRINQLKGSCTLAELERLVAHIKGPLT